MQSEAPLMRASYLKESVGLLDHLPPEQADKVRELVPAQILQEVQEATKVDWLPLDHDIVFTDVLGQVLGERGVRDLARDAMIRAASGTLLKPFINSAVKLFGLSPKGILRLSKQFWRAVYRNCGQIMTVQDEPRLAHVVFESLARQVIDSPMYRASMLGTLEGVLKICQVEGSATLEEMDRASGKLVLAVRWLARGKTLEEE